MCKGILLLLLSLCCFLSVQAQVQDTLNPARNISVDRFNMQDTTKSDQGDEPGQVTEQEPVVYKDSTRLALENLTRTAVRKSMILPGWGQIHNGRWWKAPLVVGGFVGIYLSYDFAKSHYQTYLKEAQFREVNPGQGVYENEEFANVNTQNIIAAKDFYRRNRDLSVLAGLGFYAIQLIDAYVDAKFFRYDISDDFSFKMMPSVEPNPMMFAQNKFNFGLKLAFYVP